MTSSPTRTAMRATAFFPALTRDRHHEPVVLDVSHCHAGWLEKTAHPLPASTRISRVRSPFHPSLASTSRAASISRRMSESGKTCVSRAESTVGSSLAKAVPNMIGKSAGKSLRCAFAAAFSAARRSVDMRRTVAWAKSLGNLSRQALSAASVSLTAV